MKKKEVLGFIPARGGSKGIKKKNLVDLAGKPLLYYTAKVALESSRLTRVILSTESKEIAELGQKMGLEVPFLRPPELAGDEAPTIGVVQDLLTTLGKKEGYYPEIIVILQPTSPFRKSSHIDEAVFMLEDRDADSVVSVVDVPHNFNPVSVMRIKDGFLRPYTDNESSQILNRHSKPKVYARNGAAVYAVKWETLMEKNSLFGEKCCSLLMKPEESMDIDTLFDLRIARLLMEAKGRC